MAILGSIHNEDYASLNMTHMGDVTAVLMKNNSLCFRYSYDCIGSKVFYFRRLDILVTWAKSLYGSKCEFIKAE